MPSSRESSIPVHSREATCTLPPEKVFPIQIGTELFRLSGVSLASDAPSYFSQFFEEQLQQNDGGSLRTLYIDRDPLTFQDISRHLQGYHVRPRDGPHFVKLFADAQFYSLPRLTSQLFESEIFIQIGERHFQIPRDIFSSPGDSPNFFSLGFAMFFASPQEVFPGLDRRGLMRPPAITPPVVSNRSGDIFAELLHMLHGYPIHIRNEEHRTELLRDCRYYHLRGLEQKLIPHDISYNVDRQTTEIVLRLEDIRQSGIQFKNDDDSAAGESDEKEKRVCYTRPFVDEACHELIVETAGESMTVELDSMEVSFQGPAGGRISKLAQVAAGKMTCALSPGPTRFRIDADSAVVVDGQPYSQAWCASFSSPGQGDPTLTVPRKRQREDESETSVTEAWIVRNAQWRVQMVKKGEEVEMVLVAVKMDALKSQHARNSQRPFLVSS